MVPLFEIRDLSVGYDSPLLQNISFSARPGELIAILGRNGCGKTTLLRGIAGGIRRFSGEIRVAGRDCAGMGPRRQAALISVLPQQTEILEGISACQLIEMGRYPHGGFLGEDRREREACILENARLLGIEHLLEADTARLSQGQRQLVLLCRLLVQDTPVLLLDEPNSALDYDNTYTMFRRLRQVVENKQKTALLVLHDPELALSQCHRLLIMKDGSLCADICPAAAGQAQVEQALRQIYPNVTLRKDPYDGHFHCYYQESEETHPC